MVCPIYRLVVHISYIFLNLIFIYYSGGPPAKRQAWDPAGPPPSNSNPPKSSSRSGSPLPLVTQHLPASSNMNIRSVLNHMNGNGNSKSKLASVTRIGSRKQIISWMDAPDDLYFFSTAATK